MSLARHAASHGALTCGCCCVHCAAMPHVYGTTAVVARATFLRGGNVLPLHMSLIMYNFIEDVCFIHLIMSPYSRQGLQAAEAPPHTCLQSLSYRITSLSYHSISKSQHQLITAYLSYQITAYLSYHSISKSQHQLIIALPCRAPFAEPLALDAANVAEPYALLPTSAPVSCICHRSCPP